VFVHYKSVVYIEDVVRNLARWG